MEKELEIRQVTEEEFHNMETFENACAVLSSYAEAWIGSTNNKDHIQMQSPHDENVIVDFSDHTTFPLTIEGIANGVATQLEQAGFGDIVDEIAQRHGINLERKTNGER